MARHSGFARTSLRHTHDFAELFWVDDGSAVHELNEMFHPVTEGDVVLVRPDDVHRFRSPSPDFTITNLAFDQRVLSDLRGRYYPDSGFPWEGPAQPAALLRPSPLRFGRLREIAAELADPAPGRMQLDRLLLEILDWERTASPPGAGAPGWLTEALAAWRQDPQAMAAGVSGLASIAGRSREHVSRVVRQATGRRAVDILTELRVDAAAAALRMTDDSIARIATDVGLANLSHFYRVFRRRTGTTPRRYRLRHRMIVDPGIAPPTS